MSGPEGTGARRPLRSAGWAMLGLAVAALLVGLALVVTDEAEPTAAPASANPSPTPALLPPTVTTSTTSPTSLPAPGPVSPGPAVAASPGTDAPAGEPARGEARVYNNSTITGLAAQAASDLGAAGWTVVEVDNYSAGLIPTTTVYYQEGTDQRRMAEAIGAEFGMRVEPRFVGIENARPGVIVIVTNDYGS